MNMEMPVLQIGEVARRIGISQRTVRFYEEEGLIAPAGTTSGGSRVFDESNVVRLRFINRLRILGLSVNEIKLALGKDKPPPSDRPERINRTLHALELSKQKIRENITLMEALQKENDTAYSIVEECLECPKPNCFGCIKKKYLL